MYKKQTQEELLKTKCYKKRHPVLQFMINVLTKIDNGILWFFRKDLMR